MKTLVSFSFFFLIALSVHGQDMRDTAWAGRLVKEARVLISNRNLYNALLKIDTANEIYVNTIGKQNAYYGTMLHHKGRALQYLGKFDSAILTYKNVIDIRIKVLGEISSDVAQSYYNLGVCYQSTGKYQIARDLYQKSLDIRLITLGEEHQDVAYSYNNLASCYTYLGEDSKSLEYNFKALAIRQKILPSIHPDIADSYNNLGSCFENAGEYKKAIEYYNKSLYIYIKVYGEKSYETSIVYGNIGTCLSERGDFKKALEYKNRALSMLRDLYNSENIQAAQIISSIGILYQKHGNYDQAVQYFLKALNICQKINTEASLDVAMFSNNLGGAYTQMGDFNKGVLYIEKALKISIDLLGESNSIVSDYYDNLGLLYTYIKEYEKADLCHRKALDIRRAIFGDNNFNVGISYLNLALLAYYQKNVSEAIEYNLKSIKTLERSVGLDNRIATRLYGNLVQCYVAKGSIEEAALYAEKSLFSNGFRGYYDDQVFSIEDLAIGIQNIAMINYLKYLKSANIKHIRQNKYLFDGLTKRINQNHRGLQKIENSWRYKKQGVYESNIYTNFFLHQNTDSLYYSFDAFAASEQSRSLSLYESLRESDALHFAGIPDSLLEQEYDLRVDIAYYDKKRFEEEIEKKKPLTDSTLLAINSKLFDLKRAYEALKDTFEHQYPAYYRLKYDLQVESVENVQKNLLQPDQALLEYFVGDSSVFIFLVKKDDYRVIEVKKDFPLEDWVKQLRHGIYGYHTDPNRNDNLRDSCINDYIESATALYQKLLAPVDSLLPRRVIIVPDGALGYIPFEALLTAKPEREDRFHTYPYFGREKGREHSISYCYSATLLREMTTHQHRQEPSQSFLAYAPYFDGDTTLLASRYIDPANPTNRLPPLKYAAEEVEALYNLMGGKAVIGRSARKDSLTQEAGRYRIVHLSTHGKANDKVGDYSFLAFSEIKDSLENEWLYVRDIYNLSLNADLVVLSACETGIGELKRGEGIISLARAFAYAGAKSIVTTLWSVDDAKTKDFMVFFYRNLKKGMAKDEALAKARSDYFKTHKNLDAHPYFWAGFVGIGDMGAIK